MEIYPDWDRSVDFSQVRTFTWLEKSGSAEGHQLPEHLDLRLRRVVEDVLVDKGFEPVPVEPMADVLLAYYIGLEKELRVANTSFGIYGYSYGYWPGYAGTTVSKVREIEKGTMVIDIIDRKSKQLVWTCELKSAVKSENPSGERVETVMKKMLAAFPPAP
jgi:hypothetical protein